MNYRLISGLLFKHVFSDLEFGGALVMKQRHHFFAAVDIPGSWLENFFSDLDFVAAVVEK